MEAKPMNDKTSILQLLTPKAVLKAITPEANACVPRGQLEHGFIQINQFPFSVGRESRIKNSDGKLTRIERVKFTDHEPNNNLYLMDPERPMNISREHFTIVKNSDGYALIDRNSACGTAVGTNRIGGRDSGGQTKLKDGDIITVGGEDTPYRFKFISLEN